MFMMTAELIAELTEAMTEYLSVHVRDSIVDLPPRGISRSAAVSEKKLRLKFAAVLI